MFNCMNFDREIFFSQVLSSEQVQASMASKTFMYFSYGSNMQTERIHKNNPSAKQKTIGRIEVSFFLLTLNVVSLSQQTNYFSYFQKGPSYRFHKVL